MSMDACCFFVKDVTFYSYTIAKKHPPPTAAANINLK